MEVYIRAVNGINKDIVWGFICLVVAVVFYFTESATGRAASLDQAVASGVIREKLAQDAEFGRAAQSIAANKTRLDNLDGLQAKTAALKAQLDSHQKDLLSVSNELAQKRNELESLSSKVNKVREQPVELPAGHFVVGRDIPSGRFTVVGSSNLIIDDAEGTNKVNTILGEDGVDRYVCDLKDGDQIDAHGSDRFYPMN